MKLFLVVLVLIGIYLYLTRPRPDSPGERPAATPSATAVPQNPAANPSPASGGSNFLKRPLDRTHEVIDQVKKQRRENNY